MVSKAGALFATMSNFTEEGVTAVRTRACDALLARRVETKMRAKKVGDVLNRLTVAEPKPRDGKAREVSVPPSVLAARAAKAAAAAAASAAAAQKQKLKAAFADDSDDENDDDDEGMGAGSSSSSSSAAAAAAAGGDDDDYDDQDADMAGNSSSNSAGAGMVRRWLERDKERAGGGPGVYRPDTTAYYKLRDDEWKSDIIPEVMDGECSVVYGGQSNRK